jgi:GTP-binding protein EngB required for normal cell division/uncharacterized protein (DUF697 family)
MLKHLQEKFMVEIVEDIKEELEKLRNNIKVPNIAVIGRTGAGKSTLINKVFGADIAPAGTGYPISQAFVRYPSSGQEESLVVLYDSAGYEANKEEAFLKNAFDFIDDQKKKGIEHQIHLVWNLIHGGLKRIEHFDLGTIKKLELRNIPTVIVLSQADLMRPYEIAKLEELVKISDLKRNELIKIGADPLHGEPFGVEELVQRTADDLPELYSDAFAIAQIANIKVKRAKAWQVVATAAGANFAIGYVPIPGSTPVTLVSAQVILWSKIAILYGHTQGGLIAAIGTFTSATLVSIVSTAVLDVLSFVLPASYAVTATLAGAGAATYTVVVGVACITTCEKLSEQLINSNTSKEERKTYLKEVYESEFRKLSKRIKITSKNDLKKIGDEFMEKGLKSSFLDDE